MRSLLVVALLGLASCIPEDCDSVTVSLAPGVEEYRDLPVLASGATSLLGQDIADSHGRVGALVTVSPALEVEITSLTLAVTTDGDALDARIVRQTLDAGDALHDGHDFDFWFRARSLTEILQPVNAAYSALISLGWRRTPIGCSVQEGSTETTVSGLVRTSADAGAFEIDATGTNSVEAPGLTGTSQMYVTLTNVSGVTAALSSVSARVTYLGLDSALGVPGLGLGLFDGALATQSGGAHATSVAGAANLAIYSSTDPSADGAPYAAAGTAAALGDVSGGKALVNLTINYELQDGTPSLATDTLVHVVDVP
jgi:hypothetical protein